MWLCESQFLAARLTQLSEEAWRSLMLVCARPTGGCDLMPARVESRPWRQSLNLLGRMESTMESTPHSNTQAYNSTYEGAGLIQRFLEGNPDDIKARRTLAREQTSTEIPLRSVGAYAPKKARAACSTFFDYSKPTEAKASGQNGLVR